MDKLLTREQYYSVIESILRDEYQRDMLYLDECSLEDVAFLANVLSGYSVVKVVFERAGTDVREEAEKVVKEKGWEVINGRKKENDEEGN